MLMRVEDEFGEAVRTPFPTVRRAIEYLEDNVPCRSSGSILILVSDAEIEHYKAMENGHPAKGWQVLTDPTYKKETLIVVDGVCID